MTVILVGDLSQKKYKLELGVETMAVERVEPSREGKATKSAGPKSSGLSSIPGSH